MFTLLEPTVRLLRRIFKSSLRLGSARDREFIWFFASDTSLSVLMADRDEFVS